MTTNGTMKQTFDFAIATDCENESTAITILESAAAELGLSTYRVQPFNLDETVRRLLKSEIDFGFYYDRASDTSPQFLRLYDEITQRMVPVLDTWPDLDRAADKAIMHLAFENDGIPTPYTLIIPPFDRIEGVHLFEADLSRIGKPFVVKPANTTGGGRGVVNGAESLQEIHSARRVYQDNKYLLQERIVPLEKDGRRFWFRCFYACGLIECAWWNDITHIYNRLHRSDIKLYNLVPLFALVRRIAKVSRLHFFSTEIAYSADGQYVVVDYVNEMCDLRLKSEFPDGVSDEIVRLIAAHIATHVAKQRTAEKAMTAVGRN